MPELEMSSLRACAHWGSVRKGEAVLGAMIAADSFEITGNDLVLSSKGGQVARLTNPAARSSGRVQRRCADGAYDSKAGCSVSASLDARTRSTLCSVHRSARKPIRITVVGCRIGLPRRARVPEGPTYRHQAGK